MSVPAQAARTRSGGSDADRHGLLERGRNCDAIRHANRFSTLIDGAAGFATLRAGGEPARVVRHGAMPVILFGDINEWFIRGRALRALVTPLVTSFRRAPAPRTFLTLSPLFALDRIWIHPGEPLLDVAVHRSAHARPTSDHYPLVARMRVTGGAGMKIAN